MIEHLEQNIWGPRTCRARMFVIPVVQSFEQQQRDSLFEARLSTGISWQGERRSVGPFRGSVPSLTLQPIDLLRSRVTPRPLNPSANFQMVDGLRFCRMEGRGELPDETENFRPLPDRG